MSALQAQPQAADRPVYTNSYKSIVLTLLVTAYTFNFIDRTIISTIGQAIKVDLKITDTQLGLLGGLYFALLYTFLGIPIARFAERFNRVNIISAAIVIWSGFTALCGTRSMPSASPSAPCWALWREDGWPRTSPGGWPSCWWACPASSSPSPSS